MNNLEVIVLTKHSLKEAVTENKFWNDSYEPPFSKNKAKWMLENSRADDGDTLALLGYEKHQIIAFVYLVPDLVKLQGNLIKKVFWSQRWWVSDKYKETVLSTYVKNMSLNACNNQIIIKFLGDNTKAYYEKQPFTQFSKRKRYIIIFSLDYELLVYKKSSLKKMASILKLVDTFSRKIIAIANKRTNNKINKGITYESVLSINNEAWSFLEKQSKDDLVPKSKDYINWQIDNNQYQLLKDDSKEINHRCLLGTISKKICNVSYVVKNENKIIGFISGFITGNRFIVRYFVTNEAYYNDCLSILVKSFITFKCTILQTEDDVLGERIKERFFKVYADDKELLSLIHNDVNESFSGITVKDQDGNFF